MNLLQLLNSSEYEFFYLNVDPFLKINLPELQNLHQLSPQSLNINQKISNSGELLSHPLTQNFINKTCAVSHRTPVIVPFKPSAKIEHICRKFNWLIAANDAKLNRLYEDKIKFPQICLQNDIPVIDHFIAPFSLQSFTQAQQKLGSKLVIQTHFGWAGKSTFTASSYNEASTLLAPDTLVKFSPYLEGYTLLNNCCLTRHGLIQSPPALQFTGLKALTPNPFATVGRQWPSFAPPKVINQVRQITDKFSKVLRDDNFLGFFGLDFLVSGNQVYLLECNPRLTASFDFYTRIELNSNLNPLFLFHLAEFVNLTYEIDISQENSRFYNQTIIGSEITRKNSDGATIAKYSDLKVFSSSVNPVSISSEILDQISHATS